MSLLYTSLSEDYQRDSWGRAQAVREIISNALDGAERHRAEGRGAVTVDYNARARRLTVSNEGVAVPASALLLGVSQSRDHAGCIGTFGEGLPMALLVLARLMCKVVITNGAERWEPKIVASPEYGKRVLAVQMRKLPKNHDCFTVVFEDVDESDWGEWRQMFLRFDDRVLPETVIDSATNEGQLLLDPAFKGRVYVKGVYTHSRSDLLFGYNVDIPVGRDRKYVNSSELSEAVCQTVSGALVAARGEARDTIYDALVWAQDSVEADHTWSDFAKSPDFVIAAADVIKRKFGDTPVVVTAYDYEARNVESCGGTVALVSRAAKSVLQGVKEYSAWSSERARAVSKVCDIRTLAEGEREALLFAASTLAPFRKEKGTLRVVEFKNDALEYDVQDGVLLLSRAVLTDKGSALWALARLATVKPHEQFGNPVLAGQMLARAFVGVQ